MQQMNAKSIYTNTGHCRNRRRAYFMIYLLADGVAQLSHFTF